MRRLILTLLLLGLGAAQAGANISDYLGRWRMEENAGTVLQDTSLNNRDCTITGSPPWDSTEKREDVYSARFGPGYATYCSGLTDFGLNGGTALSLGGWVYVTNTGTLQWLFNKKQAPDGWHTMLVALLASKQVIVDLHRVVGEIAPRWTTVAALSDGWHHVVVTWSRSTGTASDAVLYVDGSPVSTTFALNGYDNTFVLQEDTNEWVLGARHETYTGPFTGRLDDWRLFGRALSPADVTEWYTLAPTISDYLGRWRMDENAGTTFDDASANNRDCTITGTPAWSSAEKREGSYSAQFGAGAITYCSGTADFGLNGGTALSLGGWVFVTNTGTLQWLFDKGQGTAGWRTMLVALLASKQVIFDLNRVVSGAYPRWTTVAGLSDGWHHIVVTWSRRHGDASDAVLYVDGSPVTTTIEPNAYDNTFVLDEGMGEWVFGAISETHAYPLTGRLDDWRLFNRPLTQTEVTLWSAPVTAPDLTSNLVLKLDLNETSGTVIADSSGQNHPFTLINGDGDEWSAVGCHAGNCLHLESARTEYAAITTNASLGIGTAQAVTIGAWVAPTNWAAGVTQWVFGKDATNTTYTRLYINTAGKVFCQVADQPNAMTPSWLSQTVYTGSTLHHVVCAYARAAYNATDLVMYVDGSPVATDFTANGYAAGFSLSDTVNATTIGARPAAGTEPLGGAVDDVRVWARKLTQTDVTAWYTESTGAVVPVRHRVVME